jgi:putative polyhydroxyalkanoate system protein
LPDIQISRTHTLGLDTARAHARHWGDKAAEQFGVQCEYASGDTEDLLRFSGNGVDGQLRVTATALELQAELGFLAAMFKDKIESKINAQFDALLMKA